MSGLREVRERGKGRGRRGERGRRGLSRDLWLTWDEEQFYDYGHRGVSVSSNLVAFNMCVRSYSSLSLSLFFIIISL